MIEPGGYIRDILKQSTGDAGSLAGVSAHGWVKTRRDGKGVHFIQLNDGSCFEDLQVVVEAGTPAADVIADVTTGRVHPGRRRSGRVTRLRPGRRAEGARDTRLRHGRFRDVPLAEEAAHHGVPARHRAPAQPQQHLRRRVPRAQRPLVRDPQVLPGAGLPLPAHADHHRLRLRGRGRDVPRDDPRPDEPAPHARGRDRLRAGLLRQVGPPDRERPARGRDLRPAPSPTSTPSARPSAPRTPTRRATWPSSGWSSPRWPSATSTATASWPRSSSSTSSPTCWTTAPTTWSSSTSASTTACSPRLPTSPRATSSTSPTPRPCGILKKAADGGRDCEFPVRVGQRPADRARALPHRGGLQEAGDRHRLSQGDQGLLHAPERRRHDRARHGRARARASARSSAAASARSATTCCSTASALQGLSEEDYWWYLDLRKFGTRPARRLRPGLRAHDDVRHGHEEHPRRHPVPARAGECGFLELRCHRSRGRSRPR